MHNYYPLKRINSSIRHLDIRDYEINHFFFSENVSYLIFKLLLAFLYSHENNIGK